MEFTAEIFPRIESGEESCTAAIRTTMLMLSKEPLNASAASREQVVPTHSENQSADPKPRYSRKQPGPGPLSNIPSREAQTHESRADGGRRAQNSRVPLGPTIRISAA